MTVWDLLFCILNPLKLLFCVLTWLEERPLVRRQTRQEGGLCETCGYDLFATPRQCPECGSRTTPTARMFITLRRQREWPSAHGRLVR